MIEAKIVEDSLGPSGVRLTTFVLTYPRFIHAEFMTHRVFSRNASSSRAIPVKKQIQMVRDNPAIPLAFTKNKAGMQGGEKLSVREHELAVTLWLAARDAAAQIAQALSDLEVHKQYANRILEPFAHITVVCTATDFDNFFALRRHEAAQPEIHALADKMYELYTAQKPRPAVEGTWHLPFVDLQDMALIIVTDDEETLDKEYARLVRVSVARCARVSYLNHEGKRPTPEEDEILYQRLVGAAPIHASPAEHQAMATSDPNIRSGNFRGWIQYRKTLKDENVTNYVSTPNL